MTAAHPGARQPRAVGPLLLAGYAAAAAAVAGYALTFPSLAPSTTAAHAFGSFTATIAGAVCLGGVVLILITARPDDRGVIDPAAFRAHRVVERMSVVWLVTALVMVFVQIAADAGLSLPLLFDSDRIGSLGNALSASVYVRAWVVVAVCAAVTALGLRLTSRWDWHALLLIPAIIGVVAFPVNGNAGYGPDHDYATSSVIVFTLAASVLAGLKVTSALAGRGGAGGRAERVTAVIAGVVALAYGAVMMALLAGPPLGSGYGRLGLVAAAALLTGLIFDWRGRASTFSAVTAMAALAAVSAMAVQIAPRLVPFWSAVCCYYDIATNTRFMRTSSGSTVSQLLLMLGYELPGAPSPLRMLTFWRFDTFLSVGGLLLAALYLVGVVRLRRRGDRWPVGRTLSWLAGCVALVFATGSGVRAYGSAMFSIHMVEHTTLNMFVPVLLVLGAPVTLALGVLPSAAPGAPPGPREWIVRAVHSPFTAFLSNPITAFVLFVGSLYAVYFTPLFDTLVQYHWGHELMSLHFLITGYLFYWGIIGVDPGPRRLPYIGRLALVFATMPFHAFFGIAMMTKTTAIGGNYYSFIAPPWLSSLTDDQHLGGAIAWGASEVPLVMVVIALVAQWARQDRRTSARSDRHADAGYDDDVDAYNNMLRELARGRH
ncbi:MAG: cytochrome c oxidase assembly protein [Mycobacterium sp.]|nr:cytochrome c oxidase assembly protein [Mycobacterium sp.]